MTPDLSILCITRGDGYAMRFLREMAALAVETDAELVVAGDGNYGYAAVAVEAMKWSCSSTVFGVHSAGYIESVLDDAVAACRGTYVLRLDDDESCSPAMVQWLRERRYRDDAHWKFATANLWRDAQSVITNPPLWPDHHTRLSLRALSGGRPKHPHATSPHGNGTLAPVIHLHHKFLVKGYARRQAIARAYEQVGPGLGMSDTMRPFSLPETCYETLHLAPLGDGTLREWRPEEIEAVPARPEVAQS